MSYQFCAAYFKRFKFDIGNPVGAPSLFFWAKHVAPHNEEV